MAVDHRAGGRAGALDHSPSDVSDSALGSSGGGGGLEGHPKLDTKISFVRSFVRPSRLYYPP